MKRGILIAIPIIFVYFTGCDISNLITPGDDVTPKWKYTTRGKVRSSPAIGSDGTIYVGSDDSTLYAINPDGTLKWKIKTGNKITGSASIDKNGTVYFGSYDNYLYAINISFFLDIPVKQASRNTITFLGFNLFTLLIISSNETPVCAYFGSIS